MMNKCFAHAYAASFTGEQHPATGMGKTIKGDPIGPRMFTQVSGHNAKCKGQTEEDAPMQQLLEHVPIVGKLAIDFYNVKILRNKLPEVTKQQILTIIHQQYLRLRKLEQSAAEMVENILTNVQNMKPYSEAINTIHCITLKGGTYHVNAKPDTNLLVKFDKQLLLLYEDRWPQVKVNTITLANMKTIVRDADDENSMKKLFNSFNQYRWNYVRSRFDVDKAAHRSLPAEDFQLVECNYYTVADHANRRMFMAWPF